MPPWPGAAGAHRGGHEVGAHAAGDEGLGAVDDVVVAVADAPWCGGAATSEPPPGSVTASEPISSPASVGRTNRSTRSACPVAAMCGSAMPPVNSAAISPLDAPASIHRLLHRDRVEQVAALAADLLGDAMPSSPASPRLAVQLARHLAGVLPLLRGAAPPRGGRTRARSPAARAARRRPGSGSQQCLRDVDVPRRAATRRAPWPAGRSGCWRRRPRRAGRGSRR